MQEEFEKIKHKEIKLEADLAIRDHPEIEDQIMEFAILMTKFAKSLYVLKSAERPNEVTRRKIQTTINQISFHENKVRNLKAYLDELINDNPTAAKFEKMRDKNKVDIAAIKSLYESNQTKFSGAKIEPWEIFSLCLRDWFGK